MLTIQIGSWIALAFNLIAIYFSDRSRRRSVRCMKIYAEVYNDLTNAMDVMLANPNNQRVMGQAYNAAMKASLDKLEKL